MGARYFFIYANVEIKQGHIKVVSFPCSLVRVVSFAYSLVGVVSFTYSLVGVVSFIYYLVRVVSFIGLKISLSIAPHSVVVM